MRAFCTVSAPLEVCAPPTRPLSPGSRFLALRLLGTPQPRTLYFLVEAKSRVREVYAQTCLHFAKQGMLDTELFGLAVLLDGEYMFADPESKLSKYGPKSWRSSHTHGLDANGRPLLELYFRVQFYIESPFMLRDETSRHNYFLQLKSNTISRDIPKEYSEQSMVFLGGLAMQADLGDCPDIIDDITNEASSSSNSTGLMGLTTTTTTTTTATTPSPTSELSSKASSITSLTTTITTTALLQQSSIREYFRFEEYLPSTIRSSWGKIALRTCHRENHGMQRQDAELTYIRHACALHDVINAHVFRMKMTKTESGTGSVYFLVYAKGIKIYNNENTQPIIFLWPNIIKLSFERKKFEIRSGDQKIILYSTSDEKNKMLLTLCKETHQFSMKIATRLKDAIRREEDEEEENKSLHDTCLIYSRSLNLPYKQNSDQRISVISSTSSNTTSGIVSDRVHSEDELEIMINTPPAVSIAAPSTESLALAHLLDTTTRSCVSRQTSSVGQVSLKDLEDHLAALSVRSNTTTTSNESMTEHNNTNNPVERSCNGGGCGEIKDVDPPNSQHNVGSQCSSTCSTVVIATDTITLSSFTAHIPPIQRRRPSTSSSLELGFSHTAQNSALSEDPSSTSCIDQDYITNNDAENESVSGVYTLTHIPPTETSGVYTMNSSELTGQSSEIAESESHDNSSHYGSFQPSKSEIDNENIDSVDGQYRNRMDDDNTMTEFRMRSDSNVSASGSFRGDGSDPTDMKHTLLSAEELTDLIVGRGTYPSRETINKTLTLPLSLEADSYLQCHENTSRMLDDSDDNILSSQPPVPPKRIDSHSHRFLSNLVDCQMRSPPPYNARHEKTGLCGPPVHNEFKNTPTTLRDPPPYTPQQHTATRLSNHQQNHPVAAAAHCMTTSMIPEEVTARFITTRPQISILKAHTSVISENTKPSYAAPTITAISAKPRHHHHPSIIPSNTIGIPVPVPYNLHPAGHHHKSMSSIPPPPSPYTDVKQQTPPPRTCVLLPVIKPRQYLPPPPPTLPRQPPPPPPSQLATVYTGQLARSQIELYQQQLYSDVDYVIYPLQDPAVSQQDYLDAKQGSILAAMAQSPPPPPYLTYHPHTSTWDACKGHAIYRSTPYLPMALTAHSRYASTQNLSDTYVQLSGTYSPLYSPSVASLCSSYEPPPPPLRPAAMASSGVSMQPQQFQTLFARSRSDDNILNSCESIPKMKRLPPPPPPPQSRSIKKPPMPAPEPQTAAAPPIPLKPIQHTSSSLSTTTQHQLMTNISTILSQHHQHRNHQVQTSLSNCGVNNGVDNTINGGVSSIDIQILREKSRHMDLPLISALCNDRSLLKQTKAFVMPKHPRGTSLKIKTNTQLQSPVSSSSSSSSIQTTKSKYPVSGLRTTQLTNPRKTSISHRHPNDKLPPLPVQTIEGNNYVTTSTATPIKHTSFNSQINS